ncbi:hypothetical protein pb186bvf_005774 [Paramecium bursaria]
MATELQASQFIQGTKFDNYALVCTISCVLYVIALVVNGTLGAKTGKISNEKYHLIFTPPGWAFSIWGVIFLTTLIALIWVCSVAAWSFTSHVIFWAYCITIALWVAIWSIGTKKAMTACMLVLFAISASLYMLWESTLNTNSDSAATELMRSTIAFQLGWTGSAQVLNFCVFLAYGPLRVSQRLLANIVWGFLFLSHLTFITLAIFATRHYQKSFLPNFAGYFFSMAWACTGVYISYSKIPQTAKGY